MGKWINADYIKAIMKGDRLMQGNCEYELWKQEVDKKVDAMPSIEVMDVVTAYQQGWCDALDASINALNDAKFQLGKEADRKTEPQIAKKYDTFCGVPMAEAIEVMQKYKASKDEPQTMYYPQVDGIRPILTVKAEPSSSEKPNNCETCIWSVCNYNKAFEDEPQTEREGE